MMNQTKILPASEVKNNFGAIVNQVKNGIISDVVVENRGKPIVAIMRVEDKEALKEFREKERQKEALALLRKARARVQARTRDKLPDQEADKIANKFSREFIEDLEKEGKVIFERKST